MGMHNEHRRRDCQYAAGCTGCLDSPPAGFKGKVYTITANQEPVMAYRVVDRSRNLMTYQIDSGVRTLVLLPSDLDAVRQLLAAIDEEDAYPRIPPGVKP
jgi:hypothetical protein